jgi:hypothetical protein
MSEKRRDNDSPNESTVLLLEPFYGGSHKQLIDTLINGNDSVTWWKVYDVRDAKYEWRITNIML